MNKRKITLLGLTIVTGASIALGVTFGGKNSLKTLGGSAVEWKHFTGVEATCEDFGAKEYWTNCNGTTRLTAPEDETIVEAGAANPDAILKGYGSSDERLVAPKGHTFNNITLDCESKVFMTNELVNTFVNDPTNGKQTLEEDSSKTAPEGYGKVYKLRHAYNDDTAWTLQKAFKDDSITDYSEISFYLAGVSGEWMWADDTGATANAFEIHPSAGTGTEGIIKCLNLDGGSWRIEAWGGLKFRSMKDGSGVTSFVYNDRNSLSDIFKFPSGGWGTSEIYISDIVVNKKNDCETFILGDAFKDRSKLVADGVYSSPLATIYKYNATPNEIFADIDITKLSSIKFNVVPDVGGNTFILKGNTSSCVGGIYSSTDIETIVAVKSGTTWTVSRKSGKTFFEIPSWGDVANYVVADATKLTDLFKTFSYSSSIYLSDLVATGVNDYSPELMTVRGLETYTQDGTKGTQVYKEYNAVAPLGYGKLYELKRTYNDLSTALQLQHYFKEIDISGYSQIKFYVYSTSGEIVFADDNGSADNAYEIHPNASFGTQGEIICENLGSGSWKVNSVGFKFRSMSDGAAVTSFTYNSRNTLDALFYNPRTWGANVMVISDIIGLK